MSYDAFPQKQKRKTTEKKIKKPIGSAKQSALPSCITALKNMYPRNMHKHKVIPNLFNQL